MTTPSPTTPLLQPRIHEEVLGEEVRAGAALLGAEEVVAEVVVGTQAEGRVRVMAVVIVSSSGSCCKSQKFTFKYERKHTSISSKTVDMPTASPRIARIKEI